MERKKVIGLLALTLALIGVGIGVGATFSQNVTLIGENAEMVVENPFLVHVEWTGGGKDFYFEEGKIVKLFPGAEVATGKINITNISPLAYSVGFYTSPIKIEGEKWPIFDTFFLINEVKYRSGEVILEPGESVTAIIRVSVAYYGEASSSFWGLNLSVNPQPPHPIYEMGMG